MAIPEPAKYLVEAMFFGLPGSGEHQNSQDNCADGLPDGWSINQDNVDQQCFLIKDSSGATQGVIGHFPIGN